MLTGIKPAWREVRSLVIGLATASFLALARRQIKMFLLSFAGLSGIFYFFRDPDREPPSTSEEWILAPADGKITDIEFEFTKENTLEARFGALAYF